MNAQREIRVDDLAALRFRGTRVAATCAKLAVAALLALTLTGAPASAETPPMHHVFAAAAESTALAAPQATLDGTWTTRTREDDDGDRWVRMNMELGDDTGTWGWRVDADELEGLNWSQFDGDVDDARFELRREAGTITFEGSIRNGRGTGHFDFTPNAGFVREMDDFGYELTERRVFQAAVHDIDMEWVRGLAGLGYEDLDVSQLFAFAIHGVTVEFVREMHALGYRDIPAGKLTSMRIHGVTPEYVRQVRAAMGGR